MASEVKVEKEETKPTAAAVAASEVKIEKETSVVANEDHVASQSASYMVNQLYKLSGPYKLSSLMAMLAHDDYLDSWSQDMRIARAVQETIYIIYRSINNDKGYESRVSKLYGQCIIKIYYRELTDLIKRDVDLYTKNLINKGFNVESSTNGVTVLFSI